MTMSANRFIFTVDDNTASGYESSFFEEIL